MDGPTQTLLFQVAAPMHGQIVELRLEWTRLGEERSTRLTDDGLHPQDVPWDGVFVGSEVGPPVKDLAGRLVAIDAAGEEHLAWWGHLDVMDERGEAIAWHVGEAWPPRARPVASAWPGDSVLVPDAIGVYVGASWTALCFIVAAALLHIRRREGIGW